MPATPSTSSSSISSSIHITITDAHNVIHIIITNIHNVINIIITNIHSFIQLLFKLCRLKALVGTGQLHHGDAQKQRSTKQAWQAN